MPGNSGGINHGSDGNEDCTLGILCEKCTDEVVGDTGTPADFLGEDCGNIWGCTVGVLGTDDADCGSCTVGVYSDGELGISGASIVAGLVG